MAKLQDKFFNRVIEGKLEAKDEIQASVVQAPNGAVDKVLGINPLGKLVKGTISGGTKLYKHVVTFSNHDVLSFICLQSEPYEDINDIYDLLSKPVSNGLISTQYFVEQDTITRPILGFEGSVVCILDDTFQILTVSLLNLTIAEDDVVTPL